MSEIVELNLTVKISKRWVNTFISFLANILLFSKIGHSEIIGFYVDGDGDLDFEFVYDGDVDAKYEKALEMTLDNKTIRVYDAG